MTEAEFWDRLEKAVKAKLSDSETERELFFKKLSKMLFRDREDLRDMGVKERMAELKKLMLNAGYGRFWTITRDAFDSLLEYQNRHWAENTTRPDYLPRSNARLVGFERVSFNNFGSLGVGAVEALNEQFKTAKKENWSTDRFREEIRGISGKVTAYSDTIAQTAMRGWDRTVSAVKAEKAEIDRALYAGPPTIDTSHAFCIAHYNQTYRRDEILGMTNGQLDPVITYCGGYRCRHRWRWLIRMILK